MALSPRLQGGSESGFTHSHPALTHVHAGTPCTSQSRYVIVHPCAKDASGSSGTSRQRHVQGGPSPVGAEASPLQDIGPASASQAAENVVTAG